MTARDVALVPPQCPTTEAGHGPYFQKEFFHNGYIKSLKQLVHFYNTRDCAEPEREYDLCLSCHFRSLPARNGGKGDLLAAARGPQQHRHDDRRPRLDRSGGEPDRRLPDDTDRWLQPKQPHRQHLQEHRYLYRSVLAHVPGETARNQGNETLIPTWNLAQFPCAADICNVPPVPAPKAIHRTRTGHVWGPQSDPRLLIRVFKGSDSGVVR